MTSRPKVTLGSIVSIERTAIDPGRVLSGTKYIGLEHISGETGETRAVPVAAGQLRSAKFAFGPHHLLVGKLRPNLRQIARPKCNGICSTDILPVRTSEAIDREFLFHWLRRDSVVAHLSSLVAGVNLPRIAPPDLLALTVALPSVPEQRRIAALLDRADAVRWKRQESIRLLDEFLRSAFLEMFGDPVRNEKGWATKRIGDVVADVQYGSPFRANSDRRGLPMLRMNNITATGAVDLADLKWCEIAATDLPKYTVRRGDLLFNRTNSPELVGKTAIWNRDERYAFAGYLVRVRFDDSVALPSYVAALLNSAAGKAMLRDRAKPSVNMSNISAGELRRISIAIPPISLQRCFAKLNDRYTAIGVRYQESARNCYLLSRALAAEAFRA